MMGPIGGIIGYLIGNSLEKRSEYRESLGGGSYGAVLRAKGLVASSGKEFLYFDYVPGEISVRAGEPDATGRICVIGAMLNKRGIAELFGTGE